MFPSYRNQLIDFKSSCPEVLCKKLTGKHLRWSLFFNEVAGERVNEQSKALNIIKSND